MGSTHRNKLALTDRNFLLIGKWGKAFESCSNSFRVVSSMSKINEKINGSVSSGFVAM